MNMSNYALKTGTSTSQEVQLIERVVERGNMLKAYSQVMRNKGSAGIDKMTVEQLMPYLRKEWARIKEELLNGEYCPKPVKRVLIPKPTGGVRQLGIPTVLDRLIQQALHQILSSIFDSGFSRHSYGFRPGRNAHQAVLRARRYLEEGRDWVVDMDLEKFFDEVNHDKLMSKVAKKVKDKKILLLIRRYLQSGIMVNGLVTIQRKGTPQGGPLSPLLSNIVLDDLDKELERRGHAFCRYADDCNIYVRSEKAGQRVLESITKFIEKKLRLKVNREKSAVARPNQRIFLAYSFYKKDEVKIQIPKETIKKLKARLKPAFSKARGMNLQRFIIEDLNPSLRGWINYYKLCEVAWIVEGLDGWIRRRLRLIIWRQWKRPCTRFRKLIQLGLPVKLAVMTAYNRRGPWWNSRSRSINRWLHKRYFNNLGLVSMHNELYRMGSFRNRRGT